LSYAHEPIRRDQRVVDGVRVRIDEGVGALRRDNGGVENAEGPRQGSGGGRIDETQVTSPSLLDSNTGTKHQRDSRKVGVRFFCDCGVTLQGSLVPDVDFRSRLRAFAVHEIGSNLSGRRCIGLLYYSRRAIAGRGH
jgi:hypothetical protein